MMKHYNNQFSRFLISKAEFDEKILFSSQTTRKSEPILERTKTNEESNI